MNAAARTRRKLSVGAVGLAAAIAFAAGMTPASASAPTAIASPSLRDGEIVELWNYNSQHCLSVGAGSTAGGAGIIQWSCYGGAEQYWGLYPMPNSGGGYEIVNKNSGKCLADPASSPNAGVQLIQYGCDKGAEQTWYFDRNPDTSFAQMRNRASGLCAAVGASSTTPGAPVVPAAAWDALVRDHVEGVRLEVDRVDGHAQDLALPKAAAAAQVDHGLVPLGHAGPDGEDPFRRPGHDALVVHRRWTDRAGGARIPRKVPIVHGRAEGGTHVGVDRPGVRAADSVLLKLPQQRPRWRR